MDVVHMIGKDPELADEPPEFVGLPHDILNEQPETHVHLRDIRKVIAVGDVCMDAPEGKVCIDPKSQHMSHTIYLAKVGADHSISFPKVWEDIKPYWLGDAGCDLTKKDPMAQYTPSNPPPKP